MTVLKRTAVLLASPAALVWSLVALLTIRPQGDLDYWWHLRIGEWIVSHAEVPRTALLTWLSAGPWTAHEWASEVVLYELNQVTGPFGSIALFGGVTIAIFVVMASIMRLLRPTMSALSVALFGLIAAFVATAIWLPRAQLFDILFSLITLRVALGYLDRGERRGLWLMPLAMVAWVNLHGGGVTTYLLVMAAIVAGEWWNRRTGSTPVRPWWPLLISAGVTVLAMSANPYGPSIYLYPFGTVASPAMQALIQEWRSPDFHELYFRFAQVFVAGGLVGLLALVRIRDGRAIALTAGLAFMFLQSGRYVGLLAPLGVAVMSPWLADAVGVLRAGLPRVTLRVRWPAPLGLIGVVLLLASLALGMPARQDAVVATSEPVAATDWLTAHPPTGRLFNEYNWGGYLAYRLRIEVGPYGAADAFGDTGLDDLVAVMDLAADPRSYLDQHAVGVVIIAPRSPLDRWLGDAAEWRKVYADAVAVIYERA
ncbi:MAG: hypothetical protein ACHQ01_03610 [Candidatus Limnocylindrales bacterium]